MTTVSQTLIETLKPLAQRDRCWRPARYPKGSSIDWGEGSEGGLAIVETGLVKLSYLTSNGDEWIKSFIPAGGLFGTIGGEQTMAFGAVCLEPSTVVLLPGCWARKLIHDNPHIQPAVAQFWSWLSIRKGERERALLCESATERYLAFRTEAAEYIDRLPQGDVARYLGITPVAFSRIKRRLRLASPV